MSTEFYIILKNQNILKDKVFLKGKKLKKVYIYMQEFLIYDLSALTRDRKWYLLIKTMYRWPHHDFMVYGYKKNQILWNASFPCITSKFISSTKAKLNW